MGDVPPPVFPDHPNAIRYLQLLQALRDEDLPGLQRLVAFRATLVMAGSHHYSGTYRGPGAIVALAARTRRRFSGRSVDVVEASEGEVTATVTVAVQGGGAEQLFRLRHRCCFDPEGRTTELFIEAEDQPAFDEFLDR
jgi:ketosteroid isomerase-like protein